MQQPIEDPGIVYFGKVNFRNQMHTFGIKTDDRRRHMYVIGRTGMGKTTLLENMILSDIYAGHGCCYIDPHGDTAEKLIDYIPSWRINDVVYFNPADMQFPVGFNILESVDESMKHLVAAGLMGVFKKIWEGVWSARMEYILNNTILALLDTPGSTLLGINRMLSDKEYRNKIILNVKDPIVKQFWVTEFGNYQDKFASEAVAPIQNKVGQFLSASIIRNIVAQAKSTINPRQIMDEKKIFIVNLSKGRIGEDASRLLGGMIITKIQMAAMERVDIPEEEREDFFMFVDEFQNFAVESFAGILSEARKYRLSLIMAHQYIAQLTEEVRDAVFGNVGTLVSFRVGSPDAQFMEDEFMPRFTPEDLINLPKYSIYTKLMIDGVTSQPFSAATLPDISKRTGSMQRVVEQSRERYSGNKEHIEKHVAEWSGFGEGVDLEERMKQVKDNKKAAKKARFMHDYSCDRCAKEFKKPVELNRDKPIFCDDCLPVVKEEREARKNKRGGGGRSDNRGSHGGSEDRGGRTRSSEDKKPRAEKRVVETPPKVADGDVVEKEVGEEIGLSVLKKEEKVEKKSTENGVRSAEVEASVEEKLGKSSENGERSVAGQDTSETPTSEPRTPNSEVKKALQHEAREILKIDTERKEKKEVQETDVTEVSKEEKKSGNQKGQQEDKAPRKRKRRRRRRGGGGSETQGGGSIGSRSNTVASKPDRSQSRQARDPSSEPALSERSESKGGGMDTKKTTGTESFGSSSSSGVKAPDLDFDKPRSKSPAHSDAVGISNAAEPSSKSVSLAPGQRISFDD